MHSKEYCRERGSIGDDIPSQADDSDVLENVRRNLAAQDWPLRAFEAELPTLLDAAETLRPEHRLAWLEALHGLWSRQGWALLPDSRLSLLNLAAKWVDWVLVREIGLSQKGHWLNEEAALLLLQAFQQLGDTENALDLAINRQLATPQHTDFAAAYRQLQNWAAWRDSYDGIDGNRWGDQDLCLEPLAHHHLADFAWQYHDPLIAELCCLPSFSDDQQWHDWLDDSYRLGDQRIDAVIHRQWGFIGSVSLILHNGVGFFYYWLGPDFRGFGFAPRAVALLLAEAEERWGMHTCYAKVYAYNESSRHALSKLGFVDLEISASAPHEEEIFYRKGTVLPRPRMVEELHGLLGAMGSNTQAAALLTL